MSTVSYKSDYQFSVDECDVRDTSRLVEFRAKRDEWLHWLRHDELHAISKQISSMLWSDAVFRLVNGSRKAAQDDGGQFATQSGVIARALDSGYVAEQLIAFRKLMEHSAQGPRRGVISVRRLLHDIKANRSLMTREMYVCHDGLPFDDLVGMDELPPPDESGIYVGSVSTKGPKAFGMSELHHEWFDDYMDPAPAERARDDQISDKFFDEIEREISEAPFERARQNANKLLLHAADTVSRGAEPIQSMTLQDIWDCQRAIVKATNRLSLSFGGPNIGGIPIPNFYPMEGWKYPFAPASMLPEIYEAWRKDNALRGNWNHWR
ncbi:MAG: hypothetical protein AAFN27_20565 [Pseudomonadota bacterium]